MPTTEENFMRAPVSQPKRTLYTDLMGLDKRIRLELEQPDYEHIFYVTIKLQDRLVPLPAEAAKQFADLPVTHLRDGGLELLPDGKIILARRALLGADVFIRNGHLRLPNGHEENLIASLESLDRAEKEEMGEEGAVKGEGSKKRDTAIIGTGAGIGAGIGAIAGGAKGTAIGAGAGGLIGLAGVLSTRGRDIELPRGTELTIRLERPLRFSAADIR